MLLLERPDSRSLHGSPTARRRPRRRVGRSVAQRCSALARQRARCGGPRRRIIARTAPAGAGAAQTTKVAGSPGWPHGAPADRSGTPRAPAGRRRRPVDGELGQDPPDHRRELVGVRRPQGDEDRRVARARASSTKSRSGVSVYRQVLSRNGSPAIAGRCALEERRRPGRAPRRRARTCASPASPAGRRRPGRPWGPGGRTSGSRRTTGSSIQIQTGKRSGLEQRRVAGRREPGDLLLGHGERQRRAQRRRAGRWSRRRPRRSTLPAVTVVAVLERDGRLAAGVVDARDRACGRAASAPCAAASRRWAALPRDGSAIPASAWNSPTWPSSSRHAGQRRMISAASSRSNGTPSAVIAARVSRRCRSRRPPRSRAARRPGRRSGSRPASRLSRSTSAHDS